ncbi:MAG: Signal transduction response regulator [Promethearchaeota archaeon]|nr:MAG: Signal transduction response regulator [Candidatus Lokiarchaeota archaeon]
MRISKHKKEKRSRNHTPDLSEDNYIILLVEDNDDIRFIMNKILEFHDYKVCHAKNGEDALKVLSEMEKSPDIIISDIMMPKMDGYDFFRAISNNSQYSHIPFIFLSALDSPEDIRLGKLLGVDDYLTKPIVEEDLLATIAGKIYRNKKRVEVSEKLKQLLLEKETQIRKGSSDELEGKLFFIKVDWDDRIGPDLVYNYPNTSKVPLEKIGTQIFQAISTIYGQGRLTEAEGILINIENFKMAGYALFDSFADEKLRSGANEYMVAVIAPIITYYQSLQIKKILLEVSEEFKKMKKIRMNMYWDAIKEIFETS